MDLIYLIGPPGVGKSSVMRQLTSGLARQPVRSLPAHDVLYRDDRILGAELGCRREKFSGTDALPMNVQHHAEQWVRGTPYKLILGEGQRLANMAFFENARDAGYHVTVIALDASEGVLVRRREARASRQNPAWVQGATTRARNLGSSVSAAGFQYLRMISEYTVPETAAFLCETVPSLQALYAA